MTHIKLGAFPILADAREALAKLTVACEAVGVEKNPEYVQQIAEIKDRWSDQKKNEIYIQAPGAKMSQAQVIDVLNQEAREEDILVCAAGTIPMDIHELWDVPTGCHAQIEMGYSCMGHEIPAGIGLRMARPDGEVFVVVGDGTYLMNPTECWSRPSRKTSK